MRIQPPSRASTSLLLLFLPILTSASPLTATINSQSTKPTPTPTSSPSPALDPSRWHPVSTLLPSSISNNAPQLDLREIVNQPAGAQPALNPTQVSPVTTLMLWQTVAPGAPAQQVQVVYSQAFEEVPDQWELPVVGSIGLGTIKGTVGVVKTNNKVRRGIVAWPTTMPDAPGQGSFLHVEKVEKREAEAEAEPEPEPEAFVILPPGNDEAAIVARDEQRGLEKRKGKGGGGSGGSSSAPARVTLGAGPATLALLIALVTGMVL